MSNNIYNADTGYIDLTKFSTLAKLRSKEYQSAVPFAHTSFDNLLIGGKELLDSFPNENWDKWAGLGDAYQEGKFSCSNIEFIPEPLSKLIIQLSGPTFLKSLEELTGISKLIPDPYLSGGGLHMSRPGGHLADHTDFHIYDELDLYRRVNVLIYLNENWVPDFGGEFQLKTKDLDIMAAIEPTWGKIAIFNTDSNSIHGFPKTAANFTRRSIALYYYTSKETSTYSGDTTTYWFNHGTNRGASRKIRFLFYKLFLNTSRAFSLLAHLVNPNQGLSWWQIRKERMKTQLK